jgi:hypothetical protein
MIDIEWFNCYFLVLLQLINYPMSPEIGDKVYDYINNNINADDNKRNKFANHTGVCEGNRNILIES